MGDLMRFCKQIIIMGVSNCLDSAYQPRISCKLAMNTSTMRTGVGVEDSAKQVNFLWVTLESRRYTITKMLVSLKDMLTLI